MEIQKAHLVEATAGRERGNARGLRVVDAAHAAELADELEPVRERLFGGALAGWVRKPAVETLWREHQSGRRDRSYPLFALLMLALFLESEAARQR